MPGPLAIGQRRLRRALKDAHGNMAGAARLLGQTRSTVWEKVKRSPELQQFLYDILAESNDDWEAQLNRLAMEKDNVVATLALLNAEARDRGYNKTVNDVNVTGTVDHKHLHLHMHNEQLYKLKDAELNRMIEDRRAALPMNLREAGPLELARYEPPLIETKPTKTSTD